MTQRKTYVIRIFLLFCCLDLDQCWHNYHTATYRNLAWFVSSDYDVYKHNRKEFFKTVIMGTQVDASNSCIPPTCNLTALTPPLPTATRGAPVYLDGKTGRINSDRPVIVYGSGRLVIVRELSCDGLGGVQQDKGGKNAVKAFVYRGHTAQVS